MTDNFGYHTLLEQADDTALLAALEENPGLFMEAWAPWAQATTDITPKRRRVTSRLPYAMFNNSSSARMTRAEADQDIAACTRDLAARKVPGMWWVGSLSEPQGLAGQLEAAGFRLDARIPGMVRKIADLPALSNPRGIEIVEVTDQGDLMPWARSFTKGFGVAEPIAREYASLYTAIGYGPGTQLRLYAACVGGETVATATLYMAAGIAGLYNVTTLAPYRRSGIARALTLKSLGDAREAGFHYAGLSATIAGRHVYEDLGFRDLGQFEIYVWMPHQN